MREKRHSARLSGSEMATLFSHQVECRQNTSVYRFVANYKPTCFVANSKLTSPLFMPRSLSIPAFAIILQAILGFLLNSGFVVLSETQRNVLRIGDKRHSAPLSGSEMAALFSHQVECRHSDGKSRFVADYKPCYPRSHCGFGL